MGVIFNNLKPFIAYWISFAVYVMISLLEVFSSKNLIIAFFYSIYNFKCPHWLLYEYKRNSFRNNPV